MARNTIEGCEANQEALEMIVRTSIAPTMKNLGFKKKNRVFTKIEEKYIKRSYMQSISKDGDELDFRLYLAINQNPGNELVQLSTLGWEKGKTETYQWYQLTPEVNSEKLGKEVQEDILTYAVPFFDKFK